MKIQTSRFGEIEINKEDIVEFPEGLLGFERARRFIVLNTQDGGPFRWLQSTEIPDLAFVVIEPLQFMFSYDLEISDSDVAFLGVKAAEDVLLYGIVTIPENPRDMTANLQGPLVINIKSRKARQIVSANSSHSLKTGIISEMEKRAQKLKESQATQASQASQASQAPQVPETPQSAPKASKAPESPKAPQATPKKGGKG